MNFKVENSKLNFDRVFSNKIICPWAGPLGRKLENVMKMKWTQVCDNGSLLADTVAPPTNS